MAKKMKLAYILTADRAIQDINTRKWSLIDIFQEVKIPADLNNIILQFYVMARVDSVENSDVEVKMELLGPNDDSIAVINMRGRSNDQGVKNRSLDTVGRYTLKLSEEGQYKVRLKVNKEDMPDHGVFSVRKLGKDE